MTKTSHFVDKNLFYAHFENGTYTFKRVNLPRVFSKKIPTYCSSLHYLFLKMKGRRLSEKS